MTNFLLGLILCIVVFDFMVNVGLHRCISDLRAELLGQKEKQRNSLNKFN